MPVEIDRSGGLGRLALFFALLLLGCGASHNSSPTPNPTPNVGSAQFLYLTGAISGNQTQIFGYKVQADGSLSSLNLPSLVSTYCCHEAAAAGSVLYVADFNGGMAAMSIDLQSGQLTPLPGSPFPGITASATGSPAACPGKFLFAANGFPGGVFAFTIDPSGVPTPIPGSPFPTGTAPGRPVVDPACRFLFVTNSYDGSAQANGGLVLAFTVDGSSGKLTSVPGSPFVAGSPTSMLHYAAVDGGGRFLYVPNPDAQTVAGFSIASTGALSPVPNSPFTAGGNPFYAAVVTVSSKQFLFVLNAGSNDISAFAIDNTTGAVSLISNFATPAGARLLVSVGKFLYVFNSYSPSSSAYSVNADGTLTAIPIGLAEAPVYDPKSAAVVIGP